MDWGQGRVHQSFLEQQRAAENAAAAAAAVPIDWAIHPAAEAAATAQALAENPIRLQLELIRLQLESIRVMREGPQ
jgi:hypothetical protein